MPPESSDGAVDRLDGPVTPRPRRDPRLSRAILLGGRHPRHVVERAVRHSLCFGAYEGDRQVGFARVVTDFDAYA